MKDRISIKDEVQDPHPFVENPSGARAFLESPAEMLPKNRRLPISTKPLVEHKVPTQENLRTLHDGHTPKDNRIDKDTNPKDVIAANKLPLSLVPDTMVIYATLAFLEGALKYGRYNWRVAGVRSSIYLDALKRHIADYENGEERDPKTGVHHLANALACIGIILDAKECGKLNDDRPPRANTGDLIRSLEQKVIELKAMFADHHPHQYTISDSPCPPCGREEETLP